MRTRVLLTGCLLAGYALCAVLPAAQAQKSYPSRAVRIVVPFGPGGGTDMMARGIAERLAAVLNGPVVVENRPGGDSNVAANYVVREPADGHTIIFTNTSLLLNDVTGKSAGFVFADFSPLALIARNPMLLVTNSVTPASNVAELVAYSKKIPGKLNYAAPALSAELMTELIKQLTGLDATQIPYRSGAQGIAALLADEAQLVVSTPVPVQSLLASGRLRAVGVATEARLAQLPQVPTFREQGYDLAVGGWFAMFVLAKTPEPVLGRLESAVLNVRDSQAMQEAIVKQGLILGTGDRRAFQSFIDSEAKLWQKLVRTLNIVK
ncbi:MAG: tripartite tricarboxylate transporter substrate binding protein [Burkholderiales bacterium]|nr:tripartite tricarboxylate transporter substrate binding protein [Burkholderiales bacterium]